MNASNMLLGRGMCWDHWFSIELYVYRDAVPDILFVKGLLEVHGVCSRLLAKLLYDVAKILLKKKGLVTCC